MPKQATDYFNPTHNKLFNTGYDDGYSGRSPSLDGLVYTRGYLAGAEDKAEDEAATASGELDNLSESERDFLYGLEERASDYR